MKNLLKIFFIFNVINLFSGSSEMLFNSLTTSDGLSHSDVSCILQDHEGYIWIGTANGLNRYNGLSFTIFYSDKKDTNTLASNFITCLYEDCYGNLWIGTSNGLCRFNRNFQNFERFIYSSDVNFRLNTQISALYRDKKNKLWVGCSNGIFYLDSLNKTFIAAFTEFINNDQIIFCNSITNDKNNNLWFALENNESGGVLKFDTKQNQIYRYHKNDHQYKLNDNEVKCLFIDDENQVWIGYTSKGINVLNEKTGTISSFSKRNNNNKTINNNSILAITKGNDGKIYIGTNGGGLNIYDKTTTSFTYYLQTQSDRSLLNNTVQTIYTSQQGTILIGTWGGGVNIYDKRFDKFTLYNHKNQHNNSVYLKSVTCFAEDQNGKIWISTDGGGINYFDPVKKTFLNYNSQNDDKALSNNKVLSLEMDNSGGLWAGMWNGGLDYFQIAGNRLILKKKYNRLIYSDQNSNNIFKIYKDKRGQIWIGSFKNGVFLYDSKSDRFYNNNIKNIARIDMNSLIIKDIMEDHEGKFWISTEVNGLIMYDPEFGENQFFTNNYDDNSGIPSNSINFVFEDSEHRLWVGSDEGGLSLYNRKEKNFLNFTTDAGLPDNTIVGILEDSDNNLWISSNKGLTKAKPYIVDNQVKLEITNYSVKDGLQDEVFNRWAYFKSSTGEMYFGGINGFNVFKPENINNNTYPPDIVFTDFLLFNKPVNIRETGSPLQKHISQTKEIVLNYKQSIFTIKFIALNYIYSKKNQYAYKLEGFEKEWNYVENKNEATYTNLNHGTYIFRVKACNNDGIWNEKGNSIIIKILPPLWNTIWFKISAIIIIACGFLSIYLIRISSLKQQKNILEDKVSDRTKLLIKANDELNETNIQLNELNKQVILQSTELEIQKEDLQIKNKKLSELNVTKDKFFSIFAHDIKNPFNAILGFTHELVSNYNTWSEDEKLVMINTIHSSSKQVFELLENLLQWSQSQRGLLAYNPVKFNLNEGIEYVISMLNLGAEAKNIRIEVKKYIEELFLKADKHLFNTILRNLISNAIKFTNSGGKISISFERYKDTKAAISVKDNGIGISNEEKVKLFRLDVHHSTKGTQEELGSGLGLILIKEFIEKHGGEIWVDSELGKGSEFTFTMPLA